MKRADLIEIASPTQQMRAVVGDIVDAATKDKDRLSFLDGQKGYYEIGDCKAHPNKKNSGYIQWDDVKGWEAFICRKDGHAYTECVEHELCTFREAVDAFMRAVR